MTTTLANHDCPFARRPRNADTLASLVMRYRSENRKLQHQMEALKAEVAQRTQTQQAWVEASSVSTQTEASFLSEEQTMRQQAADMQRRLDRVIELQATSTSKYDKQVKANQKLQQANQELSVQVASMEQKLRQAEGRVQLLRQQLLERTPRRGIGAGAVRPRDFQQWMTERDGLLQQATLLTHENKRLKSVLQKAMRKYKRLQGELSELSPAFFNEIEDLKFALHQERLRTRELEAQLGQTDNR